MKIYLLSILLIISTLSFGQSGDFTYKLKAIDSAFLSFAGNNTPGAAVGIYQGGQLVYKKGFGLANLEYDIPIQPGTVFHVASISKQFTSFAILLLEKEGKLSIEDDIREYVPEIHDFGETITIRHLMSHTSGLRDQWSLLAIAGWRLDDVITKEQIFTLLQGQRELNFSPGDEYFYSNSGYFLLARIVERVSGMDFDDYMQENVFTPLGMHDTHVHDDHQMIVPGRAYSYFRDGIGYKKSVLSYANDGATSLFTTVEDLSLWMNNMFTYELGGEELIKKLSARSRLNSGEYIDYGLGQSNSLVRGHPAVGHGGSDAGFRTMIEWYPEDSSGFILLSNAGNMDQAALGKIREVLLEERETAEEKARPEVITVNPSAYSDYAGTYGLNAQFKVSLIATDPAFVIDTPFGKYPLDAHSPDYYSAYIRDAWIFLEFDKTKPYLRLKLPGETLRLYRLDGTKKLELKQMEAFTGTYYNEETKTYYDVIVEDGKLFMKHARSGKAEMLYVGGSIFGTDKWWLDLVRFEKKGNKVTGFLLGNGRVRNLQFVKT